jgi:hypothetical protein
MLANCEEVLMSEMPPGLPKHPIGTFAFVAAYAILFVIAWYAIYLFIFLARQPVTP